MKALLTGLLKFLVGALFVGCSTIPTGSLSVVVTERLMLTDFSYRIAPPPEDAHMTACREASKQEIANPLRVPGTSEAGQVLGNAAGVVGAVGAGLSVINLPGDMYRVGSTMGAQWRADRAFRGCLESHGYKIERADSIR